MHEHGIQKPRRAKHHIQSFQCASQIEQWKSVVNGKEYKYRLSDPVCCSSNAGQQQFIHVAPNAATSMVWRVRAAETTVRSFVGILFCVVLQADRDWLQAATTTTTAVAASVSPPGTCACAHNSLSRLVHSRHELQMKGIR